MKQHDAQICCHEALQCGAVDAARQALRLLLAGLNPSSDNAYSRMVVLQNLLKLAAHGRCVACILRVAPGPACTDDLDDVLRCLHSVVEEIDRHGPSTFCEGGSLAMLTWFASTAWNAAKVAADGQAHDVASRLFEHAAMLFGAHPGLEPALQPHEKVQLRVV